MTSTRPARDGAVGGLVAITLIAALLFGATPARSAGEVRIIRDAYGVPHIFGRTAEDVSYGAGYALAQDRLWQMHLFRLIGNGRLSHLLGPLVTDIDKQVRFFTYTAAERARRLRTYPAESRSLLQRFAEGVNGWIDHVRTDPSTLPMEFLEYGVGIPDTWTVDDSMALQDVLILAFGSGGGSELVNSKLLHDLIRAKGRTVGMRMFDDLVHTDDPDGPVTIPRDFNYRRASTFARVAEAESHRRLQSDARLGLRVRTFRTASIAPSPSRGTLAQAALVPDADAAISGLAPLQRGAALLQRVFRFGSNAQVVGPKWSETGNSLGTAGPQVGYLLPQWLADFGLHSEDGRLDAMGMTFAGVGPAVLIGRGRGFAWTTTTGASDLADTFVERLNPADPHEYLFRGRWERMDCRTETYELRGVPFENQEICRTRHGPVASWDLAHHVAYSVRYAWFNREGQTVEGFFDYNRARSVQDFATFANYLASNHNMFYVDDQGNYGYWHPGNFPVRALGVDIRLPQDGTGGSEWRGLLPVQLTPHAVNFPRGWLSNWNNQPAAGWTREKAWSAIDNSADLARTLDPMRTPARDPFGGLINPDRKLDFDDLSANLRYAAFRDHLVDYFMPLLPPTGSMRTSLAQRAARVLRAWDGFLVDRNGDGLYDSAGSTILDRWVADLTKRAVTDDLGSLASSASTDMLWHQLVHGDRFRLRYNWLNGVSASRFAATTFEKTAAALAAEFKNINPSAWKRKARLQHYQRLNADLFTDVIADAAGVDNAQDSSVPGDVPDHIFMDRGTYNHIVAYQTPPSGTGRLGAAAVKAGSVIPPGQSGFSNIAGRESSHYRDQLPLYIQWRYKPMPVTLAEARAVAVSEVVLST